MANLVLCKKCENWVNERCAKTKRVTANAFCLLEMLRNNGRNSRFDQQVV